MKDLKIEELRGIVADLKAKRAPSEETEVESQGPKEDIHAELAAISKEPGGTDVLRRIRDSLKDRLDKDEPSKEEGNRYEGMARSLYNKSTMGAGEYIVPAGKAVAETLSENNYGESTRDMVKRLVKNFKEERKLGESYEKQFPADELQDTTARGAASAFTFGLSEPVLSGVNAAAKTTGEAVTGKYADLTEALDSLKGNYSEDVRRRNKDREKFPEADIAGQVTGSFFNPGGGLRKGGSLLLTKFAPNLLGKGEAAIAKWFAENPSVWKSIVKEGGNILGGGLKAGTDVAEATAVRNEVLSRTGFEDEKNQLNPISAGKEGFKVGAAVSSIPVVGKAIAGAGKYGLTLLGPTEQDITYYLQNIDRLKGQNPTVAQLADEVNGAVQKIKDDFQAKKLNMEQAQKAVDGVEDSIRHAHWLENSSIKEELAQAKKQLDLAFREDKATLASFKSGLPQRHFEEVSDSVEQVRQQALQSKKAALGVLAGSKEKIPLGKTIVELEDGSEVDLPGVLDQLKAIRSSYNVKGKDTALGQQARSAQARIDDYMGQIKKMGDSVSASKLRNMVDQLDDDITAIGSITGIAAKPDATLMALRANLDQRLAVVPGWSEAIGMARESAQALGRVSNYIKQPEDVVSFLRGVGEDQNFLKRDLLHELGQRTGKDFTKITEDAQNAVNFAKSPRAMEEMKQSLPEAARVRELEQKVQTGKDPFTAEQQIQSKVQGSDQWLKLKAAEQEVNDAKRAHDMFKNWNGLNIDDKLNTMMRGKEALKAQLGVLGQMSDQDFVRTVDDLRTMINLRKEYRVGSRNVNLWGSMGAAAADGNPRSAKFMLAVILGGMADKYGPKMTRQILNGVSKVDGIITAEKINNMALPTFIKNDLTNQFAKAVYFGANSPKPSLTVGPQEAAMIRMEIQRSKSLSNIEKARQLSNLNKYGQVDTTKVLLGGQEAPLVTPDEEPNQLDAEPNSDEELYQQPPALPEIMSRLKGR